MVKRVWFISIMFIILIAGVIVEQVYTDNTYGFMENQISELKTDIANADVGGSQDLAKQIDDYWAVREVILSLFVDYRDIEMIGRQLELVIAHLGNEDLELATVECDVLDHVVKTYRNTIGFDWQNII